MRKARGSLVATGALASLVGVLSAFASTGAAHAQTPAAQAPTEAMLASRREVLAQATDAARENNHLLAIELATRAGRSLMTPSVRMFLAEQHAALGDHAATFGAAAACVSDVQRDLRASNREQILERCRALTASSRDRLVSLVIRVPSPLPAALAVRVNGQTLPEELFGLPYFVNAGSFVVESSAQGRRAFRFEGEALAGEEVSVPIELVDEATPLAVPAPGAVTPPAEAQVTRRTRRRAPRAVARAPGSVPVGPVALFSVGGAFGVTAVVSAVLYSGAIGDCVRVARDDLECPTPGDVARAGRMGLWVGLGWGSMAAGLVSIGAGAAWLAVSRRAGPPRRGPEVLVMLGGGAAGAVVQGSF